MRKKHIRKRKKTYYVLIRYAIIFAVVFAFASLIYPYLPIKPSITCANSISCTESFKLNVENNAVGIFNNQKIIPPKIDLLAEEKTKTVLGEETGQGDKHIYVDLKKQTLYAYQGNSLFMQTFISSGKWHPTPTGDFRIWTKVRATRMTGGSGADFYDLPNVPWVMFWGGDGVSDSSGFSLHGTYWHDNFGHPMSHGCVNMRIVDAKKLFEWASASPGTPVTIYGDAPL